MMALGGWASWPGAAAQGGQAAASRLVVIVDGDAPAADPGAAARLRDAVLQGIDPTLPVDYLELAADRLTAIAATDAAAFRRTVFTVSPPTYSGLRVSFAEAVEVLRGNEQARSGLAERECRSGSADCLARLRAAVAAEVKRSEAVSARKLRLLSELAAGWKGARVVLFTAGWPTRDERLVDLDRAVRELRARGASLAIVRVPPAAPFRGLVRDASEGLAARLPAGFAVLAEDPDVEPATAMILDRVAATSAAPASRATGTAPGVEAATAAVLPEAAVPPNAAQPARPEAEAAGQGPARGTTSDRDGTLGKATAYVVNFQRTFTEVVWHERYEQEDRVWRRFGASGARTAVVAGRRTLESELFFAWLPQDATWISVRDVLTVDGQSRPIAERRLPRLQAQASVSLPELRDLARENGRFNLGTIVRTFNEPTLALLFLSDRYRARVSFVRQARRTEAGRSIVRMGFEERGSPTVIRNGQRDIPARGTLDIDESTGQVWATTVEVSDPASGLTGRMSVDYQPHVAFDVLVPREMKESYRAPLQEEVSASATYSDFRRFQTRSRLILPPSP